MANSENEDQDQRQAASLLPLAAELENAIGARLRGEEVPTSASIEHAFEQAFAEVAHGLIAARLAELPPEEFAQLYVRVLGSEALRAQLDELAAITTERLQRQVLLQRIGQQAQTSGTLDLKLLKPDEIIKIGLFDPGLPQYANKGYAKDQKYRPLHRIVAARTTLPAEGKVEVLYDNWVGPVWADEQRTPSLPAMSQGSLGERLSIHVPLVYQMQDQELRPPQIIGYVETNDGTVLLDGA